MYTCARAPYMFTKMYYLKMFIDASIRPITCIEREVKRKSTYITHLTRYFRHTNEFNALMNFTPNCETLL